MTWMSDTYRRLRMIPGSGGRRQFHAAMMMGSALVYLMLVVLLSVAPFWTQPTLSHDRPLSACTDVGGIR